MATQSFDGWIEQHRRRLQVGVFLATAAEWLAIFLFVFGAGVLAVKLFLPSGWPYVLWAGMGVVPVALAAWWKADRQSFTHAETVAILDERLEAGGLLMTLSEDHDPSWQAELDRRIPNWQRGLLRVWPKRFAKYLYIPLSFVISAGAVPLRETSSKELPPDTLAQNTLQRLHEGVEWLDEADVLTEEEVQELNEEIEKLSQETEESSLTHERWEAIDSLRRELGQELEAAERSVAKGWQATLALSREDGPGGEMLSLERSEQLQKDMLETLRKLDERGALSRSPEALREQLQRLLKENQLPKRDGLDGGQQREQLLSELDEFLKEQAQKLNECRGRCAGAKLCNGDGQCEGIGNATSGQKPGRGGSSRGRGDAELTWGEESDESRAKFKSVLLPPGFNDEQNLQTVGETAAEPDVDVTGSNERGNQRKFETATGRESRGQSLRPRHRQVVREYFSEK
ncbi:hypothetical protein [Thalassoroseus pseudoceratinae]|uniref:hypothetical protein n=1 Tax=Thalassoroseus pseudoceratinae TaxID=2713176 RepID=UPI0014211028|nr:hypothetical protein [Thalassoroseus pseudoceratinae]